MGGHDDESFCRVAVFIDWQNCYRTAREAFGFTGPGIPGNVRPLILARELAGDRVPGQAEGRLVSLRIYSGQASQKHDPKTYAANRRQFQSWRNSSDVVDVVTRTLDYSLGRPREKGIDVKLAIDVVRMSLINQEHDVAIVASADTDLLPALELIAEQRGAETIEVAAWRGPNWSPSPLALAGQTIRQHLLARDKYNRVEDTRDYNIGRSSTEMGSGA